MRLGLGTQEPKSHVAFSRRGAWKSGTGMANLGPRDPGASAPHAVQVIIANTALISGVTRRPEIVKRGARTSSVRPKANLPAQIGVS